MPRGARNDECSVALHSESSTLPPFACLVPSVVPDSLQHSKLEQSDPSSSPIQHSTFNIQNSSAGSTYRQIFKATSIVGGELRPSLRHPRRPSDNPPLSVVRCPRCLLTGLRDLQALSKWPCSRGERSATSRSTDNHQSPIAFSTHSTFNIDSGPCLLIPDPFFHAHRHSQCLPIQSYRWYL